MLVSAPILPSAFVLPATAVVDAYAHKLRVYAARVGELKLEARIVVLEEVSGIVGAEELDETNPSTPLVVSQPNRLDVVCIEDLGVWRDAREAIQEVVLGRVAGQSFDNDGRRWTAWRVPAGRARARARAVVSVTTSALGGLVIVRERAFVA